MNEKLNNKDGNEMKRKGHEILKFIILAAFQSDEKKKEKYLCCSS